MEKYIVIVEYPVGSNDISREIYELLKTKGSCLQLTNYSFMILAEASAVELRDAIKELEVEIDRIFVSKMELPAAWSNSLSKSSDIKDLFHE